MIWFEETKERHEVVWRRSTIAPEQRIAGLLKHWKGTNVGVMNAAFVPVFMSLRILHKLDFLPKIPSLKFFPLDCFPRWKNIERQISK